MSEEIKTLVGFGSVKDILQVVLIPITLALLVPWITRRWQETQRELEIKTELIAEISGLVMTTVMTIYLINAGHVQQSEANRTQEDELDRVYKKWRVDTCVIGSKLHAYFPDPSKADMQIHKKWRYFSDRLTRYYESGREKGYKNSEEHLLRDKDDLFEEKARVIEDILRSRVTGFQRCRIKTRQGGLAEVEAGNRFGKES